MLRITRTKIVLAVLFAGAFTMGSAEMLVVGMLDLLVADLGVSIAAAGALVTANALGLALGGPILTALTARWDRRRVLLGAGAVFVAVTLVPVLLPAYDLFLALRGVGGAAQGLFIAAAITTATSVVPPARAGRAMATVISGFASASALGLPLGTLLGQAMGWRVSFAVVTAVAIVVLTVGWRVLPSVPARSETRMGGLARAALAPRVLALLAVCALVFTAIQSALTYLVPLLLDVTGVAAPAVGVYLMLYGVTTTLGSAAGGRFADAGAARTLVIGSIGVAASLALLWLGSDSALLAGLAVAGIGVFGMGMAPSMQHRVAELAGPGAPLAASLPSSAVNVGIAAGSLLGGAGVDTVGLTAASATGAVVAVLAIVAALVTSPLRPPTETTTLPASLAHSRKDPA
ncbi:MULTISPECIES: MFS transporter [Microbacterium]|uniref:MFS transporter n=1 Tax=Microbacterium wangchenii TaxID=2541726 RepID=A0ABX5SQ30_9MICO|nr:MULTISPECIES: MFS transporter [Microbacterium]MCK6066352.1 MFS transporter [Microbacterium sp. EYE_512]QBR87322.1 MFS transporter [Microbacterium wangchenii]TFV84575.1 MFS transporter [Microbacterium sp. dk485]TXK14643.1 MFS transporter [Microbacterium wangchenii]